MKKWFLPLVIALLLSCTANRTQDISPSMLMSYYYKGLTRTGDPKVFYNNCISKNYQKSFTFKQFELLHKGLFSIVLEDVETEAEDTLQAVMKYKVFYFTRLDKSKPIAYDGMAFLKRQDNSFRIDSIDLKRSSYDAVPKTKIIPSSNTIKLQPCAPLVLDKGARSSLQIAITLNARADNGPGKIDMAILTVLKRYDIPATLFMESTWMSQHQDFLQDTKNNPLISTGVLSTMGLPFEKTSFEELKRDIAEAFSYYNFIFSSPPRLYRPANSFKQNTKDLSVYAAKMGMVIILAGREVVYNKTQDANAIAQFLLTDLDGGTIVALPVDGSGSNLLPDALEIFIPRAIQKGFQFTSIHSLKIKEETKK
jgi:peptidoglycan/xylan/chitin deacetylase (PgdA/CDA1 family)